MILFISLGFLARVFRKSVIESVPVQPWLRRSFAAAFAGLGVHLAFSSEK